MNDTTRLLEQMADRGDDRRLASPADVRRAGEQRTRHQVARTALALAVVATLVMVWATSRHPHRMQPAPHPRTAAGLTFSAADVSTLRGVDPDGRTTNLVQDQLKRACGTHVMSVGERWCYLELVSWAPDAARAAVLLDGVAGAGDPHQTGHSDVWLLNGDRLTLLFRCPGASLPDCDGASGAGLSWSPDGQRILVASEGRMFVVDVDGNDHEPRPLSGCLHCRGESPAWSPDGLKVSFLRPDGLYLLSLDHGRPRRVAPISQPTTSAWSPDGQRIVSDAVDGLHVIDLSSSPDTQHHIVKTRPGEALRAPTWSPDGTRIAWVSTSRTTRGSSAQLWTADADGRAPRLVRDFGCCVSDWNAPVWSPDGERLAIAVEMHEVDPEVHVLDSLSGHVLRSFAGYGPLTWR